MATGTIIDSASITPENLGDEDNPEPRLAIRCACTVTRPIDGAVSVALQLGDVIIKAHQFRCEGGVPRSVEFTRCFAPTSMAPDVYSMRVVGDRVDADVVDPIIEQVPYKDSAQRDLLLRAQWHEGRAARLRQEMAALE